MVRTGLLNDFDAIDQFDPFAGDRREEIAQGRVFVAEIDERVVGYVTFSNPGFIGKPFINFLAVDPAFRRRGIASSLLDAIEKHIGTGRLFASTEEDNTVMLALFDQKGWSRAGHVAGVNDDGLAECFYFRDIRRA